MNDSVLSDRYHPVRAHLERERLVQAIDEARATFVEKGNEPDLALLRMAAGKHLRAGVVVLAAERLVEKGFANVYAYEGGIADWQEADLPMSRA